MRRSPPGQPFSTRFWSSCPSTPAPNTVGCSSCCRTKGSSGLTVFLSSKRCPLSWKVRVDCHHYILMFLLNKRPQTAEKGSTSSFEIWRGLKIPRHKRTEYYETSHEAPNVGRCIGTTKVVDNWYLENFIPPGHDVASRDNRITTFQFNIASSSSRGEMA
jgi:hypothetical protein